MIAANPEKSYTTETTPEKGSVLAMRVRDLHAFFGESHILHGLSFHVRPGEFVTLIGRNGSGRSTTLKAVMNMVDRRSGSVVINGTETMNLAAHNVPRLGVGYCPEERGIFASLSVEENLLLPPRITANGMGLDEIYDMFPNLRERRKSRGTHLSGGEQQMLAIARILRTGADILLLDEITEGLAPVIVKTLGDVLDCLRGRGMTILLAEQNFQFVAPLADRHLVLEQGQIVREVPASSLSEHMDHLHSLLGV